VQGADAVVECGGAGVADEGGDCGVDRGGAQVEVCEELFGEVDFVVGLVGVVEGESAPIVTARAQRRPEAAAIGAAALRRARAGRAQQSGAAAAGLGITEAHGMNIPADQPPLTAGPAQRDDWFTPRASAGLGRPRIPVAHAGYPWSGNGRAAIATKIRGS
jgi:hypothetical protein